MINKLLRGYDSTLELEPQSVSINGQNTFLESYIKYGINELHVLPFNKNVPFIYENGKQKFLKVQHYHSYSPYSTKLAVLISTLHRLQNNSSHTDALLASIVHLYDEVTLLCYPNSIFLRALNHMVDSMSVSSIIQNNNHFNPNTWLAIIQQVKQHMKHKLTEHMSPISSDSNAN